MAVFCVLSLGVINIDSGVLVKLVVKKNRGKSA